MTYPERLNILYCEGNIDGTVGGSFYSLFYLVTGLDRNKYRPIVVFYYPNDVADELRRLNIETIILQRPRPMVLKRPKNRLLSLLTRPLPILQKAINFLKFHVVLGVRYALLLKRKRIDLLHLNNSVTRNHEWMLAAGLVRVKCITHERGISSSFSRLSRFYARRLGAVICISQAVKDNLIHHGITSTRLVPIYNGIDPERVKADTDESAIRKKHGIGDESVIIGVIGNIKKWKGQETAVRAMQQVLARFPHTVCLLVGDTSQHDAQYHQYLMQLAQECGVENNVVFTGYTSTVANYLNCMKVVLHTSLDPEPFGRVLIEAMSMKKPVIAARAGAIPEIVEEGITGFTFVPGDHRDLADKIVTLLADESFADTCGRNGYKRLVERFDIRQNIDKTTRLYDDLLIAPEGLGV